MIEKNIFVYWEGPKPDYIKYCLKTLHRRCENVIELNRETIKPYIEGLHCRYDNLTWLAQKTDILRIALLYNHGGLYTDADTVWLKSPDHLFNLTGNIYVTKWMTSKNLVNGYILAKKKCKFLEKCMEFINYKLEHEFKPVFPGFGGCFFGEHLLMTIRNQCKNEVNILPTSIFLPFELPGNKDKWFRPFKIKDFIQPNTIAIGLNHSQYPKKETDKSINQHMNEPTLFGSVFRYSEEIGGLE